MDDTKTSPKYLRMSLAAAMTLGFKNGLFYRDARLYCINLLLTYQDGCFANCAYCGLAKKREGSYEKKSFIRVSWPVYNLQEIIKKINERKEKVKRICISMVTHPKSKNDTLFITKTLKENLDIPVSLLITPTILSKEDLINFKNAGAERIGVAIDLATKELFQKYRGINVKGPHRWEKYWKMLEDSIDVFGKRMVGAHLIVGLDETEKEMAKIIQKVYDKGGLTHLFSFFPEKGSQLFNRPQPQASSYRRIQLARYLIDKEISRENEFLFDNSSRIVDFGISKSELDKIIESGVPFMTSGCPDENGNVSCNRPYGDSLPGDDIRSYPFLPDKNDLVKIKKELLSY